MTIEQLLHISKPPFKLGGKDPIWQEAFNIYNDHHEVKAKTFCHSDYLKVARFVHKHFNFKASLFQPGPSGLSQAAKDEIRNIIKEELRAIKGL